MYLIFDSIHIQAFIVYGSLNIYKLEIVLVNFSFLSIHKIRNDLVCICMYFIYSTCVRDFIIHGSLNIYKLEIVLFDFGVLSIHKTGNDLVCISIYFIYYFTYVR